MWMCDCGTVCSVGISVCSYDLMGGGSGVWEREKGFSGGCGSGGRGENDCDN
jgi:hypothetical protein